MEFSDPIEICSFFRQIFTKKSNQRKVIYIIPFVFSGIYSPTYHFLPWPPVTPTQPLKIKFCPPPHKSASCATTNCCHFSWRCYCRFPWASNILHIWQQKNNFRQKFCIFSPFVRLRKMGRFFCEISLSSVSRKMQNFCEVAANLPDLQWYIINFY